MHPQSMHLRHSVLHRVRRMLVLVCTLVCALAGAVTAATDCAASIAYASPTFMGATAANVTCQFSGSVSQILNCISVVPVTYNVSWQFYYPVATSCALSAPQGCNITSRVGNLVQVSCFVNTTSTQTLSFLSPNNPANYTITTLTALNASTIVISRDLSGSLDEFDPLKSSVSGSTACATYNAVVTASFCSAATSCAILGNVAIGLVQSTVQNITVAFNNSAFLTYNLFITPVVLSTLSTAPGMYSPTFNASINGTYSVYTRYTTGTITAAFAPQLAGYNVKLLSNGQPHVNTVSISATPTTIEAFASEYFCTPLETSSLTFILYTPTLASLTVNYPIVPPFSNASSRLTYTVNTTLQQLTISSLLPSIPMIGCNFAFGGVQYDCGATFTINAPNYPANLTAALFMLTDSPPIYTNYVFTVQQLSCNMTGIALTDFADDNDFSTCANTPLDIFGNSATCLTYSQKQTVSLAYTVSENCGSTGQFQYWTPATAAWQSCTPAYLAGTCPLAAGFNSYRVIIPNSANATTLTYGYLNLTNVASLDINTTRAFYAGQYSSAEVTSPCSSFAVTIPDPVSGVSVLIDGVRTNTKTYSTATTTAFNYTLSLTPSPAPLSLTFVVPVSFVPNNIAGVQTAPGVSTQPFTPSVTAYTVTTGWNYINVSVSAAANLSVFINNALQTSFSTPVTTNTQITVYSTFTQFQCLVGNNVTITASQLPLTLSTVAYDGTLTPAFSSAVYSYLYADGPNTAVLSPQPSSTILSCAINYQSQNHACSDAFAQSIPITPSIQPLNVTLSVPTDNPANTSTYSFNMQQAVCSIVSVSIAEIPLAACDTSDVTAAVCTVSSAGSTSTLNINVSEYCNSVIVFTVNGSACNQNICPLAPGVNVYTFTVINTVGNGNDVNATFTVANVLGLFELQVSNAYYGAVASAVQSPCSLFTATVVTIDSFSPLINGQQLSSTTFPTQQTADFTFAVFFPALPAVVISQSVSVTPIEYIVNDITTGPGQLNAPFVNTTTDYSMNTAQPVVMVNVDASASAIVLINLVEGSQQDIALSTVSITPISISLISADFSCPNGLSYTINALQVNLSLSSVQTSAQFVPSFTATTFAYSVFSTLALIDFQPIPASPLATCTVIFNSAQLSCNDPSLNSVALSGTVNPFQLSLSVLTDIPVSSQTYSFNLQQTLCFISQLTLSDFSTSCVTEDSNPLSYSTACTIESTANTVNVGYSASQFCQNVQLQYEQQPGVFVDCTGFACPLANGANAFQVIAIDQYNNTVSTVATLNVQNIYNVQVTVSNAYFDQAQNITAPCTTFSVSISVPSQYSAAINGGSSSQVFPSATTSSLTYTVWDPSLPSITISQTINVYYLVISMLSIGTAPGQSPTPFASQTSAYWLETAYDYVNITGTPSPFASVVIDQVVTPSQQIFLDGLTTATVALQSTDFQCFMGPVYTFQLQPVSLNLSSVQTSAEYLNGDSTNLVSSYSNITYTVVTQDSRAACAITYGGVQYACNYTLNLDTMSTGVVLSVTTSVTTDVPAIIQTLEATVTQLVCEFTDLAFQLSSAVSCADVSVGEYTSSLVCLAGYESGAIANISFTAGQYCRDVTLQYFDGTNWDDISNVSVPFYLGDNNYQVVYQAYTNPPAQQLVATVSTPLYDIDLVIAQGSLNETFDNDVGAYTLTSPCLTFTVSVTQNANSSCLLDINGQGPVATFDTESASLFGLVVSLPGLSHPNNFYVFTVNSSVAESYLTNITVGPGGSDFVFAQNNFTYSVATAYSYMDVTASTSGWAQPTINGDETGSTSITLTPNTVNSIIVGVQNAQYSCNVQNYTLDVQQLPLALTTLTAGPASIVPTFQSTVYQYSVVSVYESITLALTADPNYHCVAVFGEQVINFPNCTFSWTFAVTPISISFQVTMFVPTDTPPVNSTYTFSLFRAGCYIQNAGFVPVLPVQPAASACVQTPNWPLALSCLAASPTQQALNFNFSVAGVCNNVGVQYYDSPSQHFIACGNPNNTNVTSLSQSCPLVPGLNNYNIVAQDTDNPTKSDVIARIRFQNAGWTLEVTNSYIEPPFDSSLQVYSMNSPCQNFSLQTVIQTGECANCTALINNSTDTAVFTTADTTSFFVVLCENCLAGPTLTYTASVQVFPLTLYDISTYPGGNNLDFNSYTSNYTVGTGFSYIAVSTNPSAGAMTTVNGVAGSNVSVPLTTDELLPIEVVLYSSDFTCNPAASYWINTQQVPLVLSAANTTGRISPPFSPETLVYTVLSTPTVSDINTNESSPYVTCIINGASTDQSCEFSNNIPLSLAATTTFTAQPVIDTDAFQAVNNVYVFNFVEVPDCAITSLSFIPNNVVSCDPQLLNCLGVVSGNESLATTVVFEVNNQTFCEGIRTVVCVEGSGVWAACSAVEQTSAGWSFSCPSALGGNNISISYTTIEANPQTVTLVNSALTLVNVDLVVTNAFIEPQFDANETTVYTLNVPCSEVVLNVSTNGSPDVSALINNETLYAFNPLLTPVVSVLVTLSNGLGVLPPAVAYNLTVNPGAMTGISSGSQGTNVHFAPSQTNYQIATSSIGIAFTTQCSSFALVSANGQLGSNSFSFPLASNQLLNVNFSLFQTAWPTCQALQSYFYQITQVPLALLNIQSTAPIIFTAEQYTYTVVTSLTTVRLTLDGSVSYSCLIQVNKQTQLNQTQCGSPVFNVAVPSTVAIVLHVPGDPTASTTTYTLTFTSSPKSSASNIPLIAGAAGGGGLLLVILVVIVVIVIKRRKQKVTLTFDKYTDSDPLFDSTL
eukprot:m.842972 g.842972  ORF g.842972 m.842972 type:complete len:2774 (-) comp59530_c0_seq1:120-8441(-)